MADFRRRGWAMRSRPPMAPPRLIEEEIIPPSGWIQLPDFHCLIVDLPGFKQDDIKLYVEEPGSIVVSGRRRIGENRQVHFEKSFNVPEDGDIKNISKIFEEDRLRVSVPKVATEMKEEPKKTNSSDTKRSTNNTQEKEKEKEKKKQKTESPASASSSHSEEKKKDETDESPASASSSHPKEEVEEEKKNETEETPASASSSHPKEEAEEEKKDETKETPASASSSHPKEQPEEEEKDETKETHASSSHPKEAAEEEKKDETKEEQESKNQFIVKIIENKGILIASILSFTLGVLVSQKFHPLPPK